MSERTNEQSSSLGQYIPKLVQWWPVLLWPDWFKEHCGGLTLEISMSVVCSRHKLPDQSEHPSACDSPWQLWLLGAITGLPNSYGRALALPSWVVRILGSCGRELCFLRVETAVVWENSNPA